jgi:glycosyltransferase involved in cell wall biosynthesis
LRIQYLLFDAFGMGGTVRTVLNMANYLASRGHTIDICSVMRWRQKPFFPIHPGVRVTTLNDLRAHTPGARLPWRRVAYRLARAATRSALIQPDDEAFELFSRLTDWTIRRHLAQLHTDVLVGTRPSLNLLAASRVAASVVRVGQEHLSYSVHPRRLQDDIRRLYPKLDAIVTLTDADRDAYRAVLGNTGPRIVRIANSVALPPVSSAHVSQNVIVAAGRLSRQKRFDQLIEAFARVVAKVPDCTLRIFGSGPEQGMLERQISKLGLHGRVCLMGPTADLAGEFQKASIFALSSAWEGFPMVMIEAMSCGLPVVAFDWGEGLREIVEDGVTGRIVPQGDVQGLSDALLELIADSARRERIGAGGRASVVRFSMETIGAQWADLLESLDEGRQ